MAASAQGEMGLETFPAAAGACASSAHLVDEPRGHGASAFQAFVEDFAGPGADLFTFLGLIGPTLLQPIVTFDAIGLAPFTVLTSSPEDLIDEVLADIDALVDSGELGRGPSRGLTKHLEHALRDLGRGKTKQACNQLDAFVSQANGKANGGVLDDDAAADLTAQVAAIQSQLGCGGTGSPSGAFIDG